MANKPREIVTKLQKVDVLVRHLLRGFIRLDSGPDFVGKATRDWIAAVGA